MTDAPISVGTINKVIVSTGAETVGAFILQTIRIYRGYALNEFFTANNGQFPSEWDIDVPSGVIAKPALDSTSGDITLSKSFDPQRGNLVFEFQTRLPKKRSGVSFTLKNGSDSVLSLKAKENGFYFGDSIFLGAYKEDIWQHFRVKIDTESGNADIQINGKLVKENVSIPKNKAVDSFEIYVAKATNGKVFATDFLLYEEEIPADYPSSPVKADSEGVAVGVQTCPLWTEGRHVGWDWINSAEPRIPLLGFYDESSPEAVDWQMKYMAEHGIDFQWCCWFMPGTPGNPIKDIDASRYLHNGYFNARYSDAVKFAIMWENAGTYTWTTDPAYNREMFLKHIAPFWIEYYFKDSRYFKSGGHPIVGIYSYDKFMTAFKDSTSGYSEILSMMNEFKQMCVDAGVGAPFVVLQEYPIASDFGNEGAHYAKRNQMGFDGFYTYGYNTSCWTERQKEAHLMGRDNASQLRFIPTYHSGFDTKAWDGASGITLTPQQFEDLLRDGKENFLPTLSYTNLDEPIVMLASWDEHGEGHAIMPNKGYGFGYLDAVKNVFAPGEHTHAEPTEQQKERISTAYPTGRKVPLREKITDLGDEQNHTVVKGWYFDSDSEGWTGASWENGCLKATSTIGLNNADVEAIDADYIRFKVKNQSDSYSATFTYTTNFSENNSSRMIYIGGKSSDFTEISVPVSKHADDWRGNIEKLNVVFNGIGDGQCVLIDSIEFLKTSQNGNMIGVDGVWLESGLIQRHEKKYLPFAEAKSLFGFKHYITEDGTFCFEGKNAVGKEALAESEALFENEGILYLSEDVFMSLTDEKPLFQLDLTNLEAGGAYLPDGTQIENFAKNYSRHNNVLIFAFDQNLDGQSFEPQSVTLNGSPVASVEAFGNNGIKVDLGVLSNITRYRVEFPGIKTADFEPVGGQFVFTTGTGIVGGMEFTNNTSPLNSAYMTGDYGIESCEHNAANGTITIKTTKGTYGTAIQTYANAFGKKIPTNDIKQIIMRAKTNVTGNFYTYFMLDDKEIPVGNNDREVRAGWTIQASDEYQEYILDASALNQSVWQDKALNVIRMQLPENATVDIDYIRLVTYDYETKGYLADWDFTNKQNPIGLGTIRNVNVPEPELRDDGIYFEAATWGGPMGIANGNQMLFNPSSIGKFEYTALDTYGIENFGIYLLKRGDIITPPSVSVNERFQLQQLSGGGRWNTYTLTPEHEEYPNNDCNWLFFFTNRKSGQTYWDFLLQDIKIYPINWVENPVNVPVATYELVSGFETVDEAVLDGCVPMGDVTAVAGGFYNTGSAPKDVTLVVALYKDNALVDVKMNKQTIMGKGYLSQLDVTITVPGEGYGVKAFLWDGAMPMCDVLTKDNSSL